MPRFKPETLRATLTRAFEALGFGTDDAALIARLLVRSNLSGHDTHGARLLPRYVQWVAEGHIVPGAPVTVVQETPTTAVLDGHFTLGFVAATRAVELAMDKARTHHVSAVGVRNLSHVGRAGAYPEMAAAAGLVCLAFVNAQGWGRLAAPFGGITRRVGTNPIAAAFPGPDGDPILLDFATSAVAANRIRLAAERGVEAGPGWMIDEGGAPSTDPAAFLEQEGAILPLGGDQGHKGFALAVLVDLLGGILAGAGTAAAETHTLNNGTFYVVIDPAVFVPAEQLARQVRELADYLHRSPTRPGAPPVELPGEFEARHRRARERDGVPIDEGSWGALRGALEGLGVPVPAADA